MKVEWNAVKGMQLNQMVERILHVPGNFSGGILEMTIVFDKKMNQETAAALGKNIALGLKKHSEVFRNVRLNVVQWQSDEEIINEVFPFLQLTMDSFYQKWQWNQGTADKHLSGLAEYLKLFHARSKVILLLSGEDFLYWDSEEDEIRLKQALEPFLGKKLGMVLCPQHDVVLKYREFQKC